MGSPGQFGEAWLATNKDGKEVNLVFILAIITPRYVHFEATWTFDTVAMTLGSG